MATINTPKFGNDSCPVMRLVVEPEPGGDKATTIISRWTVYYVAPKPVNTGGAGRRYVAKINGKVVVDKTYNVDQKTGTIQLATGTVTLNKAKTAQTLSISISATWNFTWDGVKASTKTGTGTITVPALATYTISYNANGGTNPPARQSKWAGTNISISTAKPTRTGYTFQGWATSSGGGVVYASGATYSANASVTLYAVWKAITYTISYNANGGTGAPASQTKTYGVDLTLTTARPTRTNYTFKGWAGSPNGAIVNQPGGKYTNNASYTYYAIWELAYAKPIITNMTVSRCDYYGTVIDDGTYALVKFNWQCDKTVSSIKIEWKLSSDSAYYSSTTLTPYGTSGSESAVIGNGELSTEQRYSIRVTVADANGNTPFTRELPSLKYIIDIKNGGNGIAFGKVAEAENYAEFGFNAMFQNGKGIWAYRPDGSYSGVQFQPVNEGGNTTLGYGNYYSKIGNTNVYGHDIAFGVSNLATPLSFRPYWRKGDYINIHCSVAGWVTSSGADVYFTLPLQRPVIGSPTITATSLSGVTIRQNNKYLYGSSASVYAKPASYTCKINGDVITVMMHFNNTTNVLNNDALGIVWDGRITFS
jgi:uncharacterized repeat protein (TIGR02543 family)